MRVSKQDQYYLDVEGDAFFERNKGDGDPKQLRAKKQEIVEQVAECGIEPARVLEFGCNYGDLLHHYAKAGAKCFGVEPSAKAVAFGTQSFGDAVNLVQGTIAQNPINGDGAHTGWFDLVVVDDVFCWVSRETLYQSIANIDDVLSDGGFLFIREFHPLSSAKNPNHHVAEGEVYCYKPRDLHSSIFTASGMYEIVARRVWMDADDTWVREKGAGGFESRWADTILRKSFGDYYE